MTKEKEKKGSGAEAKGDIGSLASRSYSGTRDELLELVRAEVRKAGGKRLTFNEFVGRSGVRPNDVQRHFARWTDVLKATGLRLGREELPIPRERLLEDWGSVARELGRAPTPADYKVRGVFSLPTLAGRLGRWAEVKEAFLKFAKGKKEWEGVAKKLKGVRLRQGYAGTRKGESGNQEIRKGGEIGNKGPGLPLSPRMKGTAVERRGFKFWRSRRRGDGRRGVVRGAAGV